jgi:Icc-related predicted phosphoesterase
MLERLPMSDMLHIAVLGDLHGHFTLAYRVLKRWEREHARTLDLILQVGDLGAFPPPFRLDKATKRFAEHDPDELGFAVYYAGEPEAEEVLGDEASDERRIAADMVFIKGNHEDFEFLAEHAGSEPVEVDVFGKIKYLAGGGRFTFERDEHALTIGALGGIADGLGGPGLSEVSENYTRKEIRKLRKGGKLDVLLSHEPPFGAAACIHPRFAEAGSPDVLALLRELDPSFHFCGHYHEPGCELELQGRTRSFQLNAVSFLKPARLNPGCIGILRWAGRSAVDFTLLAEPWLREYTRHTFRSL